MFQPQRRHRAEHSGYKGKPTKGQVLGLMALYSGVSEMVVTDKPIKKTLGVQLRLEFTT